MLKSFIIFKKTNFLQIHLKAFAPNKFELIMFKHTIYRISIKKSKLHLHTFISVLKYQYFLELAMKVFPWLILQK